MLRKRKEPKRKSIAPALRRAGALLLACSIAAAHAQSTIVETPETCAKARSFLAVLINPDKEANDAVEALIGSANDQTRLDAAFVRYSAAFLDLNTKIADALEALGTSIPHPGKEEYMALTQEVLVKVKASLDAGVSPNAALNAMLSLNTPTDVTVQTILSLKCVEDALPKRP